VTRRDDLAVFETIRESTSVAMARLALSITRDEHLARDACQEAYLELYLALRRKRPIANHRAWLRKVVVSKALSSVRTKRPSGAGVLSLEELDGFPLTRTDHVVDPAERMALQEALDELPPNERKAVGLRVLEGFSYRAVADALGCSTETAWRWVQNALGALRRSYADADGDSGDANP